MRTTPPPPPTVSWSTALWKSFTFDRAFWQDVIWRWPGAGVMYLHLVVTVIWLPLTFVAGAKLVHFVATDAEAYVAGFPMLLVEGGDVYTDVEVPYVWEFEGQELMVVDTDGGTRSLEGYDANWLVMQDTVVWRTSGAEIPIPLSFIPMFLMDRELLLYELRSARLWYPMLYLMCCWLVSITYRCIQCGVYGAAIWALTGFGKPREHGGVEFMPAMRIASIAITVVLGIDLVYELLPLPDSWALDALWGLVCFGVAVYWMNRGVILARLEPPADVRAWLAGDNPPTPTADPAA
ncbi:MAG: DUF1189 domain-containing protein [Proteobacteria bacterium]|nr:DUF1189 domain-containing protein [Pseudomonadota bacterium]MCP4917525.1 DUF1189 domain-containing protein [Pseudomonadota bacterium]